MSPIAIISLRSSAPDAALEPAELSSDLDSAGSSTSALARSLRLSLADGQPKVTPGSDAYSFTRSISTMSLYSDAGLAIYDRITRLEQYYPFAAELDILTHASDAIAARMMGLQPRLPVQTEKTHQEEGEQEEVPDFEQSQSKGDRLNQRWGDDAVGSNNQGVNGGLNSGAAKAGLVVELGAGSLAKTRHLLRALSKLLQPSSSAQSEFASIDYKALDLEHKSLVSTLTDLVEQESDFVVSANDNAAASNSNAKVRVSGICATYDEGLEFLSTTVSDSISLSSSSESAQGDSLLSTSQHSSLPSSTDHASHKADSVEEESATKSLLWLGSSIGNLSRLEAADFLRSLATNVLSAHDTLLIGIDNCNEATKIQKGYDDDEGVTAEFILEGVRQAGLALGQVAAAGLLKAEGWAYVSRWNAEAGRHEAYVRNLIGGTQISLPSVDDLAAQTVTLKKDELIRIEVSYKYIHFEANAIFKSAGLRLIEQWSDSTNVHTLYLVQKAPLDFPSTLPLSDLFKEADEVVASGSEKVVAEVKENFFGLPSLDDWEAMWKAWDLITLKVIPRRLLHTKPIELRHIFLFYLGHIPAFADIHLSEHFQQPLTEPKEFAKLFERGIDPDVADPSKINHSHSLVPTSTADWPELSTILEYESRIRQRLRAATEHKPMTRRLARVLSILIEHEAMHLETLLYIALQASNDLDPIPEFAHPDFQSLAQGWDKSIQHEGEAARRSVMKFESQTISIGVDDDDRDLVDEFEAGHVYGWDVENPQRSIQVDAFNIDALPIANLDYLTFLNTLSPSRADLFPSSWTRVATGSAGIEKGDVKVKTLYGDVDFGVAQHWPTCASYVQLAAFATAQNGRLPTEAELNLVNKRNPVDSPMSNIGFLNLHPLPPTLPLALRESVGAKEEDKCYGSNGGVWEWTSTKLTAHEGYTPSILYPGYSSDFFDDAHHKILGGSYLTPPRIAGRKSFVNWYQAPYPYVVAGARVVRS